MPFLMLIACVLAVVGTWEIFNRCLGFSGWWSFLFSLAVTSFLVWLLYAFVDRKTRSLNQRSSENRNKYGSDHKLLLCACLTGFIGMALVVIQLFIDACIFDYWSCDFSFYSEELLLGFSGVCMLIEEFRLLERDRRARSRVERFLDEMEKMNSQFVSKHNDVSKRLDDIGPSIVDAVKQIFAKKSEQDESESDA